MDLCNNCDLHTAWKLLDFWCRSPSTWQTFSHFNFNHIPTAADMHPSKCSSSLLMWHRRIGEQSAMALAFREHSHHSAVWSTIRRNARTQCTTIKQCIHCNRLLRSVFSQSAPTAAIAQGESVKHTRDRTTAISEKWLNVYEIFPFIRNVWLHYKFGIFW